jgi:hypothetical protein
MTAERIMRMFAACLPPLVALMFLHGCASGGNGPPPVPAVVMVPADADDLRYGLAHGTCREGECPAVIQLLAGQKLLDSAELTFAASDAILKKEEGDSGLDSGARLEAWTAGKEDWTVTTAVEGIKLTANRVGLLVHQVGGFEHLKRRYDLFVTDAGKLRNVWSMQEGSGPVRSAAYVVTSEGDLHQDIVYVEGFAPEEDKADSLEARRVAWDEATHEAKIRPVAVLPAVIVGEFPSARVAHAAANGTCIAQYWVVPAGSVGGTESAFALAMVVADQRMAESEMARACNVKPARRIGEFHFAARHP